MPETILPTGATNATPRPTRAQRRQARRERRNNPVNRARRLAASQRKQADAICRFNAMKDNPLDVAYLAEVR